MRKIIMIYFFKFIFLSAVFSSLAWSKPLVLVGYFDAFEGAQNNNSEKVAKLLEKRSLNRSEFSIKLCPLRTVFDKSFYQFETCLKNLNQVPDLVLGLGEAGCRFKIETIVRNLDQNIRPDNEGNVRMNTPIILGAPDEIGLNYPLAKMYCSLSPKERSQTEISRDAGSFVCNNLSYQFSFHYKNLKQGFIHVPSHSCRNLSEKTLLSVLKLEKMISTGLIESSSLLPISSEELQEKIQETSGESCENEFYKKLKMLKRKSPRKF